MDFLSAIVKDVLAIHPSVTMTFAGESDMHEGPNFRVRIENALSDDERKRIWFLGPVNRGELAVLYCRSSIFLIPSLFENAPYSLMEAMASRLPVIGANAGGIPEIVQHQLNGQLFSLDKPETLLKGIADYVNDPYFSRSCAEQAFADVKKNHSPEHIAAASAAFYQSVR
jgi:glycosyltransferase involved in cell wall biosynthesis